MKTFWERHALKIEFNSFGTYLLMSVFLFLFASDVYAGASWSNPDPQITGVTLVGRNINISTTRGTGQVYLNETNVPGAFLARIRANLITREGIRKVSWSSATLQPNKYYGLNFTVQIPSGNLENEGCEYDRYYNITKCDTAVRFRSLVIDFDDILETSNYSFNVSAWRINTSAVKIGIFVFTNSTGGINIDPAIFSGGTIFYNGSTPGLVANMSDLFNSLGNTSAFNYTGSLGGCPHSYFLNANLAINNNSDIQGNASECLIINLTGKANNAHIFRVEPFGQDMPTTDGWRINTTALRTQVIIQQGAKFQGHGWNVANTGSGAGANNNSGGIQIYGGKRQSCANCTVSDSKAGIVFKSTALGWNATNFTCGRSVEICVQIDTNGTQRNGTIVGLNASGLGGGPVSNLFGVKVAGGAKFFNVSDFNIRNQSTDFISVTGCDSAIPQTTCANFTFENGVIDGANLHSQGGTGIVILGGASTSDVQGARVDNVTIKDLYNSLGLTGVLLQYGRNANIEDVVIDNVISSGAGRAGYGLRVLDWTNATVNNSVFEDVGANQTGTIGEGVFMQRVNNANITKTIFSNIIPAGSGDGIHLTQANNSYVFNNTLSGIGSNGISVSGLTATVAYNVVGESLFRIFVDGVNASNVSNNVVTCGTSDFGILVQGGSNHRVNNNTVINCADSFDEGIGIWLSNVDNTTARHNVFVGSADSPFGVSCNVANTTAQTNWVMDSEGTVTIDPLGSGVLCNTTTVLLNVSGYAADYSSLVNFPWSDTMATVEVCWRTTYRVIDSGGSPVSGAAVNVNASYDNITKCGLNLSGTTGADGFLPPGAFNQTQYRAAKAWNVSVGQYNATSVKDTTTCTSLFTLGGNLDTVLNCLVAQGQAFVQDVVKASWRRLDELGALEDDELNRREWVWWPWAVGVSLAVVLVAKKRKDDEA